MTEMNKHCQTVPSICFGGLYNNGCFGIAKFCSNGLYHLQRLNNVQRRALHAIGPGAHLPSLAIRRTVASLACLYKLHYLPGPPQLLSVLPPRHIISTNPRTRSEHGAVSGHDHQLQHQLPASAPLALKRSFSHCSISDWNSLPAALLSQPPHSKRMQSFKTNVYRHLRSTNWLWAVDSL